MTGETDKGKHGGHKPKMITEEHCVFLRELMAEDCTVTLEFMQEQLEAVDGLRVSLTTIHNRIVGFHYSFKAVKKQCFAAITDAIKEQRREYSRWLINAVMEGRNLVYLDEVGFQVSSRVNRGRAEKRESPLALKCLPSAPEMFRALARFIELAWLIMKSSKLLRMVNDSVNTFMVFRKHRS